MQPWQIISLLPLLAFAIWLLSNLFKIGDDDKEDNRFTRDVERKGAPKRTVSDLDRFLAQTRQRREAQQQSEFAPRPETRPAAKQPQRPSTRPEARPPGRGDPEQRPQRLRDPYSASNAPKAPRRPSATKPAPTGRPVLLELAPETVPVARPVQLRTAPPTEGTTPAAPAPAAPPTAGKAPTVSPALAQVIRLLRSPESAAVGLILREILDRPRCNRPLYPPA